MTSTLATLVPLCESTLATLVPLRTGHTRTLQAPGWGQTRTDPLRCRRCRRLSSLPRLPQACASGEGYLEVGMGLGKGAGGVGHIPVISTDNSWVAWSNFSQ